FMRPHIRRILFAFVLMGLAAGSTAGRAWLMEPVLDRIFVAREGSLLLLIAGGALALALVKGLADYGEAVLMTRVGQRVIADAQAEIGQFTTLLSQTFQGARHVKAYGMEEYEERRAVGLIERLFALIDRGTRTRSRASPLMEALGGTAIAVVILYGGHQVISGARTPGALFSFITALLLAYQPLKALAILNANLQEGLAAAQRVFQLLDIEPAIRDRPDARPLRIA